MKLLLNSVSIMLLFFAISVSVNAQQGAKKDHTPEQRAEKETSKMVEKLELDESQALRVQEINLEFATKMHEAHEANDGDREAMKQTKDLIQTEKAAAMKLILNETQFTQYEEMQAKRGKRKGEKGPRGERDRE